MNTRKPVNSPTSIPITDQKKQEQSDLLHRQIDKVTNQSKNKPNIQNPPDKHDTHDTETLSLSTSGEQRETDIHQYVSLQDEMKQKNTEQSLTKEDLSRLEQSLSKLILSNNNLLSITQINNFLNNYIDYFNNLYKPDDLQQPKSVFTIIQLFKEHGFLHTSNSNQLKKQWDCLQSVLNDKIVLKPISLLYDPDAEQSLTSNNLSFQLKTSWNLAQNLSDRKKLFPSYPLVYPFDQKNVISYLITDLQCLYAKFNFNKSRNKDEKIRLELISTNTLSLDNIIIKVTYRQEEISLDPTKFFTEDFVDFPDKTKILKLDYDAFYDQIQTACKMEPTKVVPQETLIDMIKTTSMK